MITGRKLIKITFFSFSSNDNNISNKSNQLMNNSTSQPGSSTSGTFVTSSKYKNNTSLSTHQREVETELMPAPMGPIITGQMASEFFKKSDQNQQQQQSQSQNQHQTNQQQPGGQRQNPQQSQQKTLHFVQGPQSGTMVSQSGSMVSQSVSIVSQSGPMSSLVSQSGSMSSLISQAGSLASQAGSMGDSQSGSTVNLQQHEEKASFSDIDDLFPSMNNYQPGVVSATLECDATANQYQTQLFDQGRQIDPNRQIDQNTTELDQFLLSINASTTSASTSNQNQQAKK